MQTTVTTIPTDVPFLRRFRIEGDQEQGLRQLYELHPEVRYRPNCDVIKSRTVSVFLISEDVWEVEIETEYVKKSWW